MNEKNENVIPALCPKSANPYTYCPLVFVHEDDFILSMVQALAGEIMRVNGVKSWASGGATESSRLIDHYCREITAYMNGRIHELVKLIKENNHE